MKNNLIIKVKNDKYEFIVDIYDTTIEMANKLKISISSARRLLSYNSKKKKFKYIRVWFNKREDYDK